MNDLEFFIPVKTVSEANSHQHWRIRAKRAKHQRGLSALTASAVARPSELAFPLVVTLTRVSPRFLDSDNLPGAIKHCRDGIADWLGVDDRREDVVKYEYAQVKGRGQGVLVTVRSLAKAEAV